MQMEIKVNSSELAESLKEIVKTQVEEEIKKQKSAPVMVTPEWISKAWCVPKARAQRLFREFAEECLRPDSPISSGYIELTSKMKFADPGAFKYFMRNYNELKDAHQRAKLKEVM